jgi:chaperonin GroES
MSMMDAPQLPGTNPMQQGAGMPPQGMPQQPMQAPVQQPDPEAQDKSDLDKALQAVNLAETIRKKDKRKGTTLLEDIGDQVIKDFETDDTSREEWLKRNEEWMKLATQVVEKKTFPWDGAANVKFPLLSTAALQFSARAYSSLIPSLDIVKAKVVGPDMDGTLTDVANTLSTHMSYQILYEMDGWEEDLDTLCFVLPIVGVMFKKTYYSDLYKRNVSELVHAKDFVVNYYTKNLKRSPRYTHIQYFTPNEIKERQLSGTFLEYDEAFGPGQGEDTSYSQNKTTGQDNQQDATDDDTPRKILEQYRYLDLDEDDYKEPYIVTVDYETKQVLRISPNFRADGVTRDGKGKVTCITPCEWFTKFGFIPNPDGGFYDLGFGLLLGGINESVNTLTNQLLDSGTLQTLNAGFIAKGLRVGGKDLKFKVGEWKVVNSIGDDLRKNIVQLPVNQPSPVLFQLLGTLAQAGKELASVADIFTGKMPGQNTPAATTMASIEQGLKVFTSIYKRIYRSLQQEFTKIFDLNALYMPDQVTKFVSDVNGTAKNYKVSRFDYQDANKKVKIMPAADPNMVSETQKLMKINGLHELAQYGHVNTQELTRQSMVYQGQENIKELMNVPQPPPPMEIQIQQMKSQDADKDRQVQMMVVQSEARKRESEIVLNLAKARALGDEQQAMLLEQQLEREKAATDMQAKWMDLLFKREEHQMDMQHTMQDHALDTKVKVNAAALDQQTAEQGAAIDLKVKAAQGAQAIKQGDEAHQQKLAQMKQTSSVKEKNAKRNQNRVA